MKITPISKNLFFKGMPENYSVIDTIVSRSAQPALEDFTWLKEQGVTDIINFRTMTVSGVNFEEEEEVKKLGMNYHNIPSITSQPKIFNVGMFLLLIKQISERGGKAHIHCKAGADRTGMYSFIYKTINGIGTIAENDKEWVARGHNTKRYPYLRTWAKNVLRLYK